MRPTLVLLLALPLGACRSDTGFTPLNYRQLENDHGQWLSMKTAPDGRLGMTFFDRTVGGIGFALATSYGDELRWEYERVAGYPSSSGVNPGVMGTYTSLAFAPDGTAWASFHHDENGTLMVAKRVNREWTSEVVDPGSGLRPKTGLWTSIGIDGSGQPVVVYHDERGGTLRMARRNAAEWTLSTIYEGQPFSGTDDEGNAVERPADVGEYATLHIVGNTEYIAFFDRAQQSLVLLEGFAGAYSATVVDTGGVGQWPSLSLAGESLAIAYHDVARQHLRLAIREGGGTFQRRTIDDGPYRGADTAVFQRGGKWSIVYFDGRNNDARLAVEGEPGSFALSQLGGASTAVGFHNEVAQDGFGRWWAVSYDYTNRNLFAVPLDG